ncbi:MAG: hypothetical protein N2C14_31485, partial [Planctomycetales bacterium]
AKVRTLELDALLSEEQAIEKNAADTFVPDAVISRLQRLDEILAGGNVTLANLELSRHIEGIDCHGDGRVVLRGTLLGMFDGAVELLSQEPEDGWTAPKSNGNVRTVRARRRGRLRIDDLSADSDLSSDVLNRSLDPDRFSGLSPEFMWEETFLLSRPPSWAEAYAIDVGELRLEGWTIERLCTEFDRTPPTIRRALDFAKELDERFRNLPKKTPRSRWHEDHALEVADLKAKGLGTDALAAHFLKSDTMIRKALAFAKSLQQGDAD